MSTTYANWSRTAKVINEAEQQRYIAKERGRLFVQLFAAAKQLVDNHPKRFPYLEFNVKEIEAKGLAPKLVEDNALTNRTQT